MSNICTQEDAYSFDQKMAEARWYARLSDGTVVIQDDSRPGAQPPSAWLRLAEHLRGHPGLRLVELWLSFRDANIVRPLVPQDADGYFFRKAVCAFQESERTFGFYLVGHLEQGVVHVQRWKVPEMLLIERETRDPASSAQVGPSLIRNPPRDTKANDNQ